MRNRGQVPFPIIRFSRIFFSCHVFRIRLPSAKISVISISREACSETTYSPSKINERKQLRAPQEYFGAGLYDGPCTHRKDGHAADDNIIGGPPFDTSDGRMLAAFPHNIQLQKDDSFPRISYFHAICHRCQKKDVNVVDLCYNHGIPKHFRRRLRL